MIDAVQIPGFGKKGRMLTALRVLARPEAEAEVARTIFAETTTLGLRLSRAARALLPRSDHSIETGEATVTVKRAERPGGATAKAASEDLADHSRAGRETLRRRAEAPETGE